MKIAFLCRCDINDKFGGDTNQILIYKKQWEVLGHEVDLIYDGKLELTYDIYIVTNSDRYLEAYFYLKKLQKNNLLGKTFFLTIHHDYNQIRFFEKNIRGGVSSWLTKLFGLEGREKIKSIYHSFYERRLLFCSFNLFFISVRRFYKKISNDVVFIFLSKGEKKSFERDFNLSLRNNIIYTKNGVSDNLLEKYSGAERTIDVLVCGRIEKRKNSVNIAQELSKMKYINVAFVGGFNRNDDKYNKDFMNVVSSSDNIKYLGSVDKSEVHEYFRKSKIHLSASWFEVASLVDLESYACGCGVISSTNGYTKEYLGEKVLYINPNDIKELPVIISEALKSGVPSNNEGRSEFIKIEHSWAINAKKLISDIVLSEGRK